MRVRAGPAEVGRVDVQLELLGRSPVERPQEGDLDAGHHLGSPLGPGSLCHHGHLLKVSQV